MFNFSIEIKKLNLTFFNDMSFKKISLVYYQFIKQFSFLKILKLFNNFLRLNGKNLTFSQTTDIALDLKNMYKNLDFLFKKNK